MSVQSIALALRKSPIARLAVLPVLAMLAYACVNEAPAPTPRNDADAIAAEATDLPIAPTSRNDNDVAVSPTPQAVSDSQELLTATPASSEENPSKANEESAEATPVMVKGRPTASYMPDQGFVSLDERILRSVVIVRATMRSVSAASLGQDTPTVYFPMIRFAFDAHEYLKGDGGDVITADIRVSCSGCSYLDSEQEAIDVANDWIASELDRWWEDRESILFLDENELANSEASGQSASTMYKFIPWIEYRLPIHNYATTDHYPYSSTDGFSVIAERHRVWLPSVATSSGASGASDSRFMLGENPNDPYVQSAAGFSSFDADISLSALKSRIKAVADLLAQGEGGAEYEDCLRMKFMLERIPWEPYAIELPIQSGRRAGAVVISDALGGREYYGIYFFTGADESFFEIVIEDDDSDPYEIYYRTAKTLRPLVAGDYSVVYHQIPGIIRFCIDSPVEGYTDIPTANWTIRATAPEGTLHEAFFDPVVDDDAIAAGGSLGKLKPDSFTADSVETTIQRIGWTSNKVAIRLVDPPASLADHHIDFIALDGAIALRLAFGDAAVAGAGDVRSFSWGVCGPPWQAGDKLMLRISESAPGLEGAAGQGTCADAPLKSSTPAPDAPPTASPAPTSTATVAPDTQPTQTPAPAPSPTATPTPR